ncbi:hypothetical protein TWF696_006586 [Orbilia brochopaga]|uniref:Uncharacterized protein n=1 Tax=Orbilia brochopaga TaxID=3140254 RepID=A0AAV9UZU5_9PEZI
MRQEEKNKSGEDVRMAMVVVVVAGEISASAGVELVVDGWAGPRRAGARRTSSAARISSRPPHPTPPPTPPPPPPQTTFPRSARNGDATPAKSPDKKATALGSYRKFISLKPASCRAPQVPAVPTYPQQAASPKTVEEDQQESCRHADASM